jgi:molybdopterin converting factor small subunit
MNVTVSYFGQARRAAGVAAEVVAVPEAASVADAVRAAAGNRDALRKLLFTPEGALRRSLLAPVNGEIRDVGASGILRDGDRIEIFTAISGG